MLPKWISEKEKTLLESPVMKVLRKDCFFSEDSSKKHRFYVLESPDWCNIIPVTSDGKVVLIKQYRIGIDDYTLEIPGGVVDTTDDGLEKAAIREMTEETGYVPLSSSQCISLGKTLPNPAIQNNHCHLFVVGPVERKKEQELDPGEIIEVEEVEISQLPQLILSGKIEHALMLNSFFLLMLNEKKGKESLREALSHFKKD